MGCLGVVVKHEDIRIVSIKTDSFLYVARLSLNLPSWYDNHLEADVQLDNKTSM